MNSLTLILVFLIIVIFIFITIKEKRGKKIKKTTSASKKGFPPKPKRPFFWSESVKEMIRWVLLSLICLILLLFVVRFVVSLFSETAHQTTTSSVYVVPKKKILGYIDVTLSGKYGDRIYLYQDFPRNSKFQFINATIDYSVINKDGKRSFALAGQDASGQLGFSNGNIWLRFRSQSGQKGSLKIMMYIE